MRTPEWLNLTLFSFFVLVSWVWRSRSQSRVAISVIGILGISSIIAAEFTARVLSPLTVSVIRDWLPTPLMPMVYWQAGRFAGQPNDKFQQALHRLDGKWVAGVLRRLTVTRSYHWLSSSLELAYLSCYVLVPLGLGALYIAHLRKFANEYWLVILSATYPCYVFTAFVPTLPPRLLEADSVPLRKDKIRRFNLWIIRHLSHRLNTFPSAHVTATLGGSLVLLRHAPKIGILFLLVSIGIALGALTGRYHYAADVVVASVVVVAVFIFMILFT